MTSQDNGSSLSRARPNNRHYPNPYNNHIHTPQELRRRQGKANGLSPGQSPTAGDAIQTVEVVLDPEGNTVAVNTLSSGPSTASAIFPSKAAILASSILGSSVPNLDLSSPAPSGTNLVASLPTAAEPLIPAGAAPLPTTAVASTEDTLQLTATSTATDVPQSTAALDSISLDSILSLSLTSPPIPLPTDSVAGLLASLTDGTVSSVGTTASVGEATSESATADGVTSIPPQSAPLAINSTTVAPFIFKNATSTLGSWSNSTFATPTGNTVSGFTDASHPVTALGGGGGGNGNDGSNPANPTSTTQPGSAAPTAPPTPQTVVGGVLGSLAGVALIVAIVIFALRWKRRQQILVGDRGGARGLLTTGGGNRPDSSGGGGTSAMAQQTPVWSVPAALASLTGSKRLPRRISVSGESGTGSGGAETAERGFYRIAGRKLPSILQTGGDGYGNDPFGDEHREHHDRDSMSQASLYNRDSQGFYPGGGNSSPGMLLALGSPMRPVSGVPVFREGPGRTPVTAHSPMSDDNPFFDPLTPPRDPLGRDPLGRSLTSQDGSRGSGSRFTEDL